MIKILILSTLIPITGILCYFVGKQISKRKIKRILSEGTGRMGIIHYSSDFRDTYAYIEVEELEVAGNLTKIKIHNVSPYRNSKAQDRNKILGYWGQSDWVKTSSITWYENNTQKIRDKKLEKILE